MSKDNRTSTQSLLSKGFNTVGKLLQGTNQGLTHVKNNNIIREDLVNFFKVNEEFLKLLGETDLQGMKLGYSSISEVPKREFLEKLNNKIDDIVEIERVDVEKSKDLKFLRLTIEALKKIGHPVNLSQEAKMAMNSLEKKPDSKAPDTAEIRKYALEKIIKEADFKTFIQNAINTQKTTLTQAHTQTTQTRTPV
jgi:hypothetical protein